MDRSRLSSLDIARLKRREAELLKRVEKLKQRMNETKEMDTLAAKAKLLREVQDELKRVHEKLAGRGADENPE
jgi:hypothetical protein